MRNQADPPQLPRQTVRIEFSLRSVLSILAIVLGLWLLIQLWPILLLFIMAILLATTLNPLVVWLEQHHVKRGGALLLVLLAFILLLIGLGFLLIPSFLPQAQQLIANAPEIRNRFLAELARIPLLAEQTNSIRQAQPEMYLVRLGRYLLVYAPGIVELLAFGLTSVILALYLIADRERMKGLAFALIPPRFHLRAARLLLHLQTVVSGYVLGQVLTSLLISIFTFVLLWLVGAPSPLAFAILAAFTDLIPEIGGILVTVPAALAALTQGVVPAVVVVIALVVYQEFEGRVLIQRVYGRTLRLSPVAVTMALLIGGKLLGILGALLALPLAAGIRAFLEDMRIHLPGERLADPSQQERVATAEAAYLQAIEGLPVAEAAKRATAMVEQFGAAEPKEPGAPGEELTE
jgi:predicted PurR-regulated permease PerM